MEELRSTEILDKEIQSDARKKAEKILLSADSESKRILDDVSKRMETARKDRSAFYDKKVEQYAHDAEAALPLEKQRYLVSYIGKSVSESIDEYLKSLSEDKRFELVKSLFARSETCMEGKKMNALVYGFDLNNAKKFLSSKLGSNLLSVKETIFEKTGQSESGGLTIHEGIILESDDKTVRCRLTLEELICEIEESHSQKLAESLFGGRMPE